MFNFSLCDSIWIAPFESHHEFSVTCHHHPKLPALNLNPKKQIYDNFLIQFTSCKYFGGIFLSNQKAFLMQKSFSDSRPHNWGCGKKMLQSFVQFSHKKLLLEWNLFISLAFARHKKKAERTKHQALGNIHVAAMWVSRENEI